jgi:hypothetical protein
MPRPRLTYANVISTVALFLALSGGVVYAAGKITAKQIAPNAVRSRQIKNGTVTSADVKDNGLTGQDIDEGTLGTVPNAASSTSAASATSADHAASSADAEQLEGMPAAAYLRYGSAIPSGRTITGAFGSETGPKLDYGEIVSFAPLRAPANLTSADVNFAAGEVEFQIKPSEESKACTGTVSLPTAPAGKACLYIEGINVGPDSAEADSLEPGVSNGSRLGFSVHAGPSQASGGGTFMTGTWAYTAP